MQLSTKSTSNREVFVFGSNQSGIHGAGSAKHAYKHYGAKWGVGEGFAGRSYAIPTKDRNLKVLSLDSIRQSVNKFLIFARDNQTMTFKIVKIGCGLAGYSEYQIMPLFDLAPENCILPDGWIGR